GEDILMKGDGGQLRSWCYVVDCVSALLHILLKGVSGQAYNVADSASVITIGELASLVARIAGRRVIAKGCGGDAGGSTVRMAVFDTSRLEGLGWSVAGTMEDKMRATIEERMALGGAAR
ncbi:MAG: NAD-dependent epimerase/dehydratase family protein, partial [Treponema sp.]|nr:NAD-dependent epimerase/dehydratase family protein [Treponema sp.]